ncbi:MAG: HNH endonuclease [Selenomonadaceae bacterium]|nr:HNH endonuclease [Selenomonadaceae bacterium]
MDKKYWQEYDRRRYEDAKPAYHALMSCYPFTLDNLDGEQWKPVVGFEGYQISNFGRVKSFKKGKTNILKPALNGKYLSVSLSIGGEQKWQRIHLLVARAFIPNPLNKPEVNHDDGRKFNCHVSNLFWATQSENQRHAVKNGLAKSGIDRSQAKIKSESDIIYIRENTDKLTQEQLAEKFGVKQNVISLIQQGKTYANAGGTVRTSLKQRVPDEIRAAIRADYATGNYSIRALARKYGYSHKTVWNIVHEEG